MDHILLIFFNIIFTGDGRNETAWPSLHHGYSQLKELVKSSAHVDLTIFILSFDNIDGIFGEGGSLNISTNNSEFYSRLFLVLNFEGGVRILAILLMVKICFVI